MEFLTTIVVEIGKYLLQPVLRPVERRVGYLVHCKENTEQLKNQVEKLKTVRESVQQLIDQAESRGEDILIDVTNWMGTVDSVINEANGLVDNSNVDSRCFIGLCPHCCSRYQLSKKAAEMMNGVNDLQEIGGCFNVVSHPLSPPPIEALCEGDFNVFESTRQVMEKVMNALRDQSINFIGLYGMGGVGKTTLVKEVGKRVQNEEKIFNKVVMAAVSQNPVLRNIQDDIASMLDLNFDPIENEKRRAWKLSERIKKENTILVILDDVWERLELGDVGIPHGDNHKGCKITLTTRREQVCRAMEVQERILLGTLCEQDAWSLFKSKAGSVVDDDNLRHVAREVAKECGGLPIALVTIARALRNEKELQAWKDTVTTLRKNEPNRIEGVDKKVISCIRLSYDYLNDREAQWLFLFCSLFPEDYNIEIEQMARYVFGLGCFENVDTIEDARCRVRMVVKKLKTSSLLLDGFVSSFLRISPSEEHFKMHDIVRDVAISMASDDSHHEVFLGRAGRGLTEYPKMESSERYTAISLISNSIWKLPNRSGLYPKLRVLLLQENRGLTEIADTFFEGMESLRVLDLSRTQVERFPPSIRCLTNLRTLHFVTNKQYLVDISMIGELKKLVILSLRSCLLSSAELPENIAHLTNLRMLDLSDSTQGANLVNVISGLYQLEELYLKLGGDLPDDFVFQGFVRFNIWINYMTSSYCTGTAAELYENTPHTLCLSG
uniref:AAA+ ATPase domain-containing protein n=1 Tax=Nelumbo nucifera TaxID=4432 RepID=A0A822Z6V4_NELNU|nr:TPA_asm: hypothetical protein HUJ06_013452 [Nelumbo nucifera]